MSAEAWPLFVRDGVERAARLAQAHTAEGTARTAAAVDAAVLATTSALLGLEELSLLARAVERGLDGLGRPGAAATLAPAVAAATRALTGAFATLAAPDASGARLEPGTGEAELRALDAVLGPRAELQGASLGAAQHEPEAATAIGDPGAPAIWTPTVDEDMVDLFFQEAEERLDGLSEKLLVLEEKPDDGEHIRELFRDLHTLKGSSGMVGLRPMNQLAHAAEDLVGHLRDGDRKADRPVVDALLASLDGLRAILDRARRGVPIDVVLAPLIARVRDPGAAIASEALAPAAGPAGTSTVDGAAPASEPGARAASAQRQTLRVDFDKLDLLLNLVGELVLARSGLSEGLLGLGGLGRELGISRRLARRPRRVGAGGGDGDPGLRAIGDELGRMERVFSEVSQELVTSSDRLDHVSAELRDQVMKLRMVPIGGTFRKHGRTIRDLANTLGKRVKLVLEGEDTELDKVLVEQLEDPLMHLVRNAVDHGMEPPDARTRAGKPAEGTITLNAFHRGNTIVIEIKDDGAGIDPSRLRAKALEKGVATAEELAGMDDRRAMELIFRPGFSTAAQVSEVSGRGVGMDVVRETIVSRLKGSVDVTSVAGVGSTFTLRLPLTLAVIQVLLLGAGGDVFAIPLDIVTRTLTVAPADVHRVMDREVLTVQGRQVPLIRLRDVLELESLADHSDEHLFAILVEVFGQTYGVLCERLLGKQEVVIKTLGDLLEDVWGAAGATLLGERCVLILNVAELIQGGAKRGVSPPRRAKLVEPRPGAGARVLLVEDSDTVRESLRRLLVGAGYEVVEARDGQEGLTLAEAGAFDLISTDVMMPHLDGYDLTRALRQGRHRDTPIVMVTSRGEKIDQIRGFDAGVDAYITKPHDRQDYLKTVAKLLGARGGTEGDRG